MMESFATFLKRKVADAGSYIYRRIVFPFMKMGIERRSDSIIGKGAYLYKGTTLEGKDFIGDGAELANVLVGYSSFIGRDSVISNTKIGKYSCIAGLETAIGRHPVKGENISVYPAFYSNAKQYGYSYVTQTTFEEAKHSEDGYNIVIGNDVWMGRGVMIIDGVTVGDGAVIGARSLVTEDIEPYAIYAGSPAKKIGSRFDEDSVNRLMEMKWWDKGVKWIEEHANDFSDPAEFFKKMV